MWHVYLLECADGTLYCGVACDPLKRLAEHNGERPGGARYTRGRRPCRLLAWTRQPDRASACRLEARIKACPRREKLARLLEAEEITGLAQRAGRPLRVQGNHSPAEGFGGEQPPKMTQSASS